MSNFINPRKPKLSRQTTTMRRFVLLRHKDFSGVSGRGIVADGCEYPGGEVVMRWRGESPSLNIYAGIKAMLRVHNHAGATEVVWLDDLEWKWVDLTEFYRKQAERGEAASRALHRWERLMGVRKDDAPMARAEASGEPDVRSEDPPAAGSGFKSHPQKLTAEASCIDTP